MWPLDDITVYYYGTKIQDTSPDWDFRKTVNFVSDYYHDSLEGYKPPKTGRICIQVSGEGLSKETSYFGSICRLFTIMDEELYPRFSKPEQYRYLLDLIHNTIIEAAEKLGWDKSHFELAYLTVLNSDFVFEKCYKEKKSRNRKRIGVAVLSKTEDRAILKVITTEAGATNEAVLFDKKNWYWEDSSYRIAAKCKWIDEDSFGYESNSKDEFAYYSMREDKVKTNMNFEDSVF